MLKKLIFLFLMCSVFSAFAGDTAVVASFPAEQQPAAEAASTPDQSTEQAETTPAVETTLTDVEPSKPVLKSSLVSEDKQENKYTGLKTPSNINLVRPGSKLRNPYADLVNLGLTGTNNSGVKNYADAVAQYCKTARDEQDANAMFALAWLYTNGRGVEKNEDMAALFFSMAAERGHPRAQAWLSNNKGDPANASMPSCMKPDPVTNIASVNHEALQARKAEAKQFYTKGPIYKLVSEIAPKYNIDVDLVMAFIAVESGFNPNATSPMNAQGLMQLIPETAARFKVKDPYNPADNIKGGVAYIQWLLSYFKGDIALVAAAYNAGENAVTRHKGIPPYAETQAYVKKITSLYGIPTHNYREDLGITPALMNVSATNSNWPKTKKN